MVRCTSTSNRCLFSYCLILKQLLSLLGALKVTPFSSCLRAVISIRGTLSMDDCLTDFMCEPAEMDSWLSTAATAHSGKLGSDDPAGDKQGSDPHGLVGSGEGHGFGQEGRRRRGGARPGANLHGHPPLGQ